MLRRRLAKGDSSICAFCRYRISLQRTAEPLSRLFSVTSQSASDNDPSHSRTFRPLPPAGSWDTPIPSQTSNLSTTSIKRQESESDAYKPTGYSPQWTPYEGSKPVFRKQHFDDILNPDEVKARQRLLAQHHGMQQKEEVSTKPFGKDAMYPRVNAKYVWDWERQLAIERYLKAEAAQEHGSVKKLKRRPTTLPALSLKNPVGSDFKITYEPDSKSLADRMPNRMSSFFRRVAHHEDPPLRKVPAGPVRSSMDTKSPPPTPLLDDKGSRTSPDTQDYVESSLSSLTGSESFWKTEPKFRAIRPLSKVTVDNDIKTASPSSQPSEAASALIPSKPEITGNVTTGIQKNGWDALEEAVKRDADQQLKAKMAARDPSATQEWGQLARKPANKTIKEDGFWNAIQSNVAKVEPRRAGQRGKDRISPDPWAITPTDTSSANPSNRSSTWSGDTLQEWPDPWAITSTNTTAANSSSRAPAQNEGIAQAATWSRDDNYDRERSRRREPFERAGRGGSRRGKRSQRGSRFDDNEDGDDAYDQYQEKRRQKEQRKAQREADRTEPIPIILPELISVTAFANALKIKPEDFLVQLGELGFEGVTLDSLMAGETAALVAQEYGFEPTVEAGDSQDLKPRPPPEDLSIVPSRPPVVTIMGHVDHGKTTILDYLRKSSVAAQEHGGITQHIGAFSVKLSSGKPITFLDTPGHAAFLTMRQRGANVTDIVVLVVAADDSVKPQTLEALKHARAAKVPIIVAVNKIDKDGARIDAVKHDLAKAGLEIEDFGGDVQVVCVSGKTGQGMDDLEENILTLSEILDHRAEFDGPAEGWVLESSLKSTGKVATVLVKRGTLRPGDYIAAGLTWAKIRQLRNESGVPIDEAPPGTPVEVLGWKDLPAAGDQVIQSPDEDKAKRAVSYREGLREREKDAAEYEVISESRKAHQEKRALEKSEKKGKKTSEGGTGVQEVLPEDENGTKMVNFIIKGDVHGSVEAVCAAIQEIGSHEVRPRVLLSATGPICESDVEHAAIAKAVIVNFATTTPGHVRHMAEEQGVRILDHNVIYHLVDDVKANLSEYLAPDVTTRVLGEAEVLQVFPINVRGRVFKNIAGCRVRNGVVGKNNLYRVLRHGEKIFEGKLETLKHVKKDVMEMRKGTECGMGFEEFQDLRLGDQIQAYEEVTTTRSL